MDQYERIYGYTQKIIRKYGTHNVYDICSQRHIIIRYMPLGKLKAFSVVMLRVATIAVNESIRREYQPVLIGHELYHLLDNRDDARILNIVSGSFAQKMAMDDELRSHIFIGELLAGDDDVLKYMKLYNGDLHSVAQYFCVPDEIMNIKFESMKRRGFNICPPCPVSVRFLAEDFDDWFYSKKDSCQFCE